MTLKPKSPYYEKIMSACQELYEKNGDFNIPDLVKKLKPHNIPTSIMRNCVQKYMISNNLIERSYTKRNGSNTYKFKGDISISKYQEIKIPQDTKSQPILPDISTISTIPIIQKKKEDEFKGITRQETYQSMIEIISLIISSLEKLQMTISLMK